MSQSPSRDRWFRVWFWCFNYYRYGSVRLSGAGSPGGNSPVCAGHGCLPCHDCLLLHHHGNHHHHQRHHRSHSCQDPPATYHRPTESIHAYQESPGSAECLSSPLSSITLSRSGDNCFTKARCWRENAVKDFTRLCLDIIYKLHVFDFVV